MDQPEEIVAKVKIFDQVYTIKGQGDSRYVQELAEYVDRAMRRIAQGTSTVDTLKIAVLAALNIADDYFQLRRRFDETNRLVANKSSELASLLDSLLERSGLG